MPSENKNLRRKLINELKPLHAIAVENSAYPGTPDVNYADGWIELKDLDGWPKRKETVVRIPHFTHVQRIWLSKRWAKSRNVWMIIKCRREFLLIEGHKASQHVGRVTRDELYDISYRVWKNGLITEELIQCLKPKI